MAVPQVKYKNSTAQDRGRLSPPARKKLCFFTPPPGFSVKRLVNYVEQQGEKKGKHRRCLRIWLDRLAVINYSAVGWFPFSSLTGFPRFS